jgi:undecaprenyl-diphosphatase
LLQIVALAVVQGVTEFLPVGADAHLALVRLLLPVGQPGVGLSLNLGAALAIAAYFHSEIAAAGLGLFQSMRGRRTQNTKLAGKLLAGSMPWVVAAAVLVFAAYLPAEGSRPLLGWAMLGGGVLLLVADRIGMTVRRVEHIGVPTAILLGVAQALALVPGVGRLAATLTVARFIGIERQDAARYAFLIGLLPTLAIAAWQAWMRVGAGAWRMGPADAAGGLASFIACYLAIAFFMNWLRRGTVTPFALYRIVVGGAILYVFYT